MTFLPDQFSSVTQSYPILFKPVDCSTSGVPVPHHLLKLMAIKSMIPSHHLILCCPLLLLPQSFPASGPFQMNQLFPSGGQNIGVSASTSVLPMNTQDWLDFLAVQGTLKSFFQYHNSKASILWHSAFFIVQL